MLQVIKIGGAALNDAGWLQRFADAAKHGKSARVIVHGGGPEITQLTRQLGIATSFTAGGRRITSAEAMDATSMVLNGRINKRIVRALRSRGIDALGISGEDGGLISAEIAENAALGRVGEVVAVRVELLLQLVGNGMLPVVSPVSIGSDFGPLNVNADEVATAVAQKMEAQELLFLTDVDGVLHEGSRVQSLSAAEARTLIETGIANGGMGLKLNAALSALKAGVAKVRVGSLEMLWNEDAGTAINAEAVACRQ